MHFPDLTAPPKLAPNALRIIPLGGLGDIGRNMTMLELNHKILLIDCGVLFPEDAHPGVDLILPALDVLAGRLDDIVGLVLTHGHEDHIGAVPFLLKQRQNIPVFGSQLTLGLLETKFREHQIRGADLRTVRAGERVRVDEFDLEFVAVNHSIPDALAIAVRTVAGTLLHTGDFKMDQLPLDGRITDLRAFARLGEEGVDLFLTDSTNAEVPGFTTPEKDLQPAIDRVFATTRQRLVVACFASHVHRVQQVMDAAVRHGRKVCYIGRSMVKNMGVAADLGYLDVPDGLLVPLKEIDKYRADELLLISTGSQGEPLSALSRMAARTHPAIELSDGDTVLLASSLIPGNENSVYRVINGLSRLGVNVVHKGNALVHVSGHASAGELLYAYNIVQPRQVLPVHGEVRHLIANGELARATGVPADKVLLVEDGGVIDMADGRAKVVGRVDAPYIFVDGTVGGVTESQLSDRLVLGAEGFISAVAVVDLAAGKLVTGPEISARGFLEGDQREMFGAIGRETADAIRQSLGDGVRDVHQLQQVMRRQIGRWVSGKLRRRPMIVPVVVAASPAKKTSE